MVKMLDENNSDLKDTGIASLNITTCQLYLPGHVKILQKRTHYIETVKQLYINRYVQLTRWPSSCVLFFVQNTLS